MTTTYYAYTRLSTQRQSDQGVSLIEQRRSIASYAADCGFLVSAWFEETETAARRGRPMFEQLLDRLAHTPDPGLLVHRIDRSARNLRDWADLGELIDRGVDVRFTHDDVSLDTRGARLSADIQAVIAADYIRNLREEIRKGIGGRLAQGLYPFGAPFGYRDQGSGLAKTPDPQTAPLVIYAFERYVTGEVSLSALASELRMRGAAPTPSTVAALLRRRFYVGDCIVRGQAYPGIHQPLIDRGLFNQAQEMLRQRHRPKRQRLSFRDQRRLRCEWGYALIGERQKGRTYYRCHTCPGVSVREEVIDQTASERRTEILIKDRRIRLSASNPVYLQPYAKFDSGRVSAYGTKIEIGEPTNMV